MPGFPIIRVNPIPILQRIGTLIFTNETVHESDFVIVNAERAFSVTETRGLTVSAINNYSARTIGD